MKHMHRASKNTNFTAFLVLRADWSKATNIHLRNTSKWVPVRAEKFNLGLRCNVVSRNGAANEFNPVRPLVTIPYVLP